MIKLTKLTKEYQSNVEDSAHYGVFDIDLDLPSTGLIVIEGKSGCGKTTLLNILGCIDSYDSGSYSYNGNEIKDLSREAVETIRLNDYAFIFQDYRLFDELNILENVTYNCSDKNKCTRSYVGGLTYKLGVKSSVKKECKNLSGGEKQRVAIARALLKDPKVIFADEPTGNLDSKTSIEVMNILKDESTKRLIVMVSHNHELASEYADQIIKMSDGHIIEVSENKNNKTESLEKEDINIDKPNFAKSYGKIRKVLGRNVKNNIIFGILDALLMIFLLITIALFNYSKAKTINSALKATGDQAMVGLHYEYEQNGHYYDYDNGGIMANSREYNAYPSVKISCDNETVNNYSQVYMANFKYFPGNELSSGHVPSTSDELLVSDYLYARNNRQNTIGLEGKTYTISGIYKTSYTGMSSLATDLSKYDAKAYYGMVFFYGDYDYVSLSDTVNAYDFISDVSNVDITTSVSCVANSLDNSTTYLCGRAANNENEIVISKDYFDLLDTDFESLSNKHIINNYSFEYVSLMNRYSPALDSKNLKVVGVVDNAGSGVISYFNSSLYTSMQETYTVYFAHECISRINVNNTKSVATLLNAGYSFTYFFEDTIDSFTLYVDVFRYLGLILSIVLLIIIVLMMVKDFKNLFVNQRQNIGIMLTLGVHQKEVVFYVALHYAFTEIIGLVIASLLNVAIVNIINTKVVNFVYMFSLLSYPWVTVIVGFVVIIAIAILLATLGFRKLNDNRVSSWMKKTL